MATFEYSDKPWGHPDRLISMLWGLLEDAWDLEEEFIESRGRRGRPGPIARFRDNLEEFTDAIKLCDGHCSLDFVLYRVLRRLWCDLRGEEPSPLNLRTAITK